MSKILTYLRGLVGNNVAATIGIFAFIAVFCLFSCHKARGDELDIRGGTSFGHSSGPVIGLQYLHPISGLPAASFYAGTLLWGKTSHEANNWDWHAGIQVCKWEHLCASLGATYVQRLDDLNGAHTNYNLELSYRFGFHRFSSIDLTHISDAGTSAINTGRQAALVAIKLQ